MVRRITSFVRFISLSQFQQLDQYSQHFITDPRQNTFTCLNLKTYMIYPQTIRVTKKTQIAIKLFQYQELVGFIIDQTVLFLVSLKIKEITFHLLLKNVNYTILIKFIIKNMAGRGKNSKTVGKTTAAKRTAHRPGFKPIAGGQITNGAIRRLARRGGVQRISSASNNHVREYIDDFLNRIVRDSLSYCEHRRAMTITALDVVYALKKNGRTLYGYGP